MGARHRGVAARSADLDLGRGRLVLPSSLISWRQHSEARRPAARCAGCACFLARHAGSLPPPHAASLHTSQARHSFKAQLQSGLPRSFAPTAMATRRCAKGSGGGARARRGLQSGAYQRWRLQERVCLQETAHRHRALSSAERVACARLECGARGVSSKQGCALERSLELNKQSIGERY
jgi:hypothetical protein